MGEDGILLSAEMADRLLAHAREQLPNEACALIGGETTTGRATSVHLARNLEASPYRFDVHPDDLVRIVLGLEASGEALLAIFHSHTTTAAVPSAADVREARYPVIQVLASLDGANATSEGALRAWRIENGAACEVPLTVSGRALGAGTPPSAPGSPNRAGSRGSRRSPG